MSTHQLTDDELATITNALLIACESCTRDAYRLGATGNPSDAAVAIASLESAGQYKALANRIDSGETEVEE
jgi:hypothetical protein